MDESLTVHPPGECIFEFPTYDGKVVLRPTDDALTPFGGLVPWAAFQKKTGILEKLSQTCPVPRTSPNATPVYDLLCSFMLNTLCDGRRFSHVARLREDPTMASLFGMKRGVAGTDAILRFFHQVPDRVGRNWVAQASTSIWRALPESFIMDWDSTVQTRFGHQEGAEVGYNPHKQGRPSHHPLLAVVAGTRLCPYYRWRPGRSAAAGEWQEAMSESLEWLGGRQPWLNRGDIGFGQEDIMAWHECAPHRPRYLFKLKLTANVRRAIGTVPESAWEGQSGLGVLQVAEVRLQLHGWSCPRRVILGRRLRGVIPAAEARTFWDETKHEFEAYVTNLSMAEAKPWQCVELYRRRAECENVFDELKNHWGFNGFCCRKQAATALAARLLLLSYNLWNLFLRLMQPERHVEAFQGRRWFLLIAARLVHSGRQKELHVAVNGAWWNELTAGYKRVCEWLKGTASQLVFPMPAEYPLLI